MQFLVNSFKTDVNGLPLLDANGNDLSNAVNMTNDMGIASSAPFTPYQENVDPRLDWSVGRRGVSYLDGVLILARTGLPNKHSAARMLT